MGVGVEIIVGICLECILEMFIVLWVIFKVGGVYVFFDLVVFFEWIVYILEDI